uniref:Aminoacyl-tRNA synthetase, class 1a, anticodon-binding n=1 Tax=Tanacetum cinerariifolium TaxID=118510 RepID=A0A699HU71_TANCI|nr:aminoacyl-tRNA synthetase, class 1a, anticodon-binding [Tanacetum cinerariifolium]
MPAPDQPQDQLSTPPRQRTSDPTALVFEHGQNEPLGGSFHMSPPRSTQAPPAGQTSGGVEDLITQTELSSVVSTLVQKVNSLETKLKDHKKLFKDVVGKLVKKVKTMEVKLRTMKKKMVVSDSDQEEGGKPDVDLDAPLALANAAVTVDSNIPPGGTSNNPAASTSVPADVLTSANVPIGSTSVPADVPTSVAPAGVSNKGKTLMVEEDITVKERTFKQMKDDRLCEQAAKMLHEEEQAQIHAFIRTLKRTCPVFEEPSSKKQKYTEASIPSVPEVPQSLVVSSPKSSGTRRKSLGKNRLIKPKSNLKELDLDADDQTFIKVISNEDSEDEAPFLWFAFLGWEVITTPLGDINALYRIDRSTAYFTTLKKILHMVDRQDLLTLYRLVVKYYENHPVGETVSGEVVYMFADVSYPFSVNLMERMLKHKLETDKDVVGNDMTTAEQLIQFIKNQLAAVQFAQNYRFFNSLMLHLLRVEMVINSPWIMPILGTKELASPEQTAPVFEFKHADAAFSRDIPLICTDFSSILVKTQSSRYVVPTGRVVVPTGRYVVPVGSKDLSRAGSNIRSETCTANKKCVVNVDVFRTILDICPRVKGVNFTDAPDDDITLAFLIKLGYKGPLYKHTNMFIDHMHQPWRTLETIINKCLSGKTASNEKLRRSRIDILRGMCNEENVDYPELIWEDLAFQIDHRKEKRSRREDYQEYGLVIPEVMLNEAIKKLESYQMFIKYSTSQIPPKKSRGKASQRKKTADDS